MKKINKKKLRFIKLLTCSLFIASCLASCKIITLAEQNASLEELKNPTPYKQDQIKKMVDVIDEIHLL